MRDTLGGEVWWEELNVESGTGFRFTLGPLAFLIFRLETEWQIAHEHGDREQLEDREWSIEPLAQLPADPPGLERFVSDVHGGHARLGPRAADRTVVVRPRIPLHVLPGGEARVYVSSPAWVEILVGRPVASLRQLPTTRLTDSWVGGSTLEGEVAYGLKTYARSNLESVPRRSHRVITPIVIYNRAEDELLLDRVNLPVPFLSVFAAADRQLWTESVTLTRKGSTEMAELAVDRGAPSEAAGAELVGEPRTVAETNLLVRAFSSLLHPFEQED